MPTALITGASSGIGEAMLPVGVRESELFRAWEMIK